MGNGSGLVRLVLRLLQRRAFVDPALHQFQLRLRERGERRARISMGVELAEMQLPRGAADLIAQAMRSDDPYAVGPYGKH